MRVWSLGQEDPMEKQMATHSSILAWRIPWTEEPGRQQSIESQRVRHDWSDSAHMHMPQFYQGGHNDALVTGINDYRTLCPTVFEMSGYFPLPRVKLPKQIAGVSVGKGLGDSLPYRLAVGLQDSSSQEPSFSFSQCSLGLKPRLDEETGQGPDFLLRCLRPPDNLSLISFTCFSWTIFLSTHLSCPSDMFHYSSPWLSTRHVPKASIQLCYS